MYSVSDASSEGYAGGSDITSLSVTPFLNGEENVQEENPREFSLRC